MEITSIISQHVKALNRDAMCALSLENFPMTAVICTRDTIEIICIPPDIGEEIAQDELHFPN